MNDYRINFQLPAVSPGPAIKQEKPEQVCEFREFETKVYGVAQLGRPGATKQSIEKQGPTVVCPGADSAAVAAPPKGKWVPSKGDQFRVLRCDAAQPKRLIGAILSVRLSSGDSYFIDDKEGFCWNSNEVEPIDTSPAPSGA